VKDSRTEANRRRDAPALAPNENSHGSESTRLKGRSIKRLNEQPAAGQKQLEMGRLAIHSTHLELLLTCGRLLI